MSKKFELQTVINNLFDFQIDFFLLKVGKRKWNPNLVLHFIILGMNRKFIMNFQLKIVCY